MENYELQHSGIRGMKWGVRRFQYKDGSLTPEGAKRYGSGDGRHRSLGQVIKDRKTAKKRKAALEKARQAKAEKKKLEEQQKLHEEAKQKAIKSGSAADVLKFKSELTKPEMDAVWARLQWEQNVSGIAAKDVSPGEKKVAKIMDNLNTATTHVNTLAKAWNTAANINNAFNINGKLMPKIDTNITNGNRKEVKAERKERAKAEEAKKQREEQEAQRESKHQERAEKKAKQEAEQKQKEAASKQTTKKEPEVERYEATGDDVFGEGTSKFTGWKNTGAKYYHNAKFTDVNMSDISTSTELSVPGKNYVNTFLLEDKTGR